MGFVDILGCLAQGFRRRKWGLEGPLGDNPNLIPF